MSDCDYGNPNWPKVPPQPSSAASEPISAGMTPEAWEAEFGDHTECPVCGTDCMMLATSDDTLKLRQQLAASREELAKLQKERS